MSAPVIGLVGFVATLLLVALRLPVAIAMGVAGAVGYAVLNGWAGVGFVLGTAPFEAVFPYGLSVVPLFVLMGIFAARSGLSRALYDACYAVLGHRPGGLAMATIGACAGFAAICGSSLATAATMGRVALPEMRRLGYDDRLAAASVAAGGTLGILIPPSIILVIYGLLTGQSIGALFAAALLPGVLGTLLYMLAIAAQTWVDPTLGPPGPRLSLAQQWRALREVRGVALLFGVAIGGMYFGWFSPTEAAAVGAFGAFLFALLGRALTKRALLECMIEAATTSGMIFLIMVGAGFFNFFIETSGLPQLLVQFVQDLGWGPYPVLLLVMGFYIVLGCLMDSLSMVLLTIPFAFPLIAALDVDPIWFGVLLVTVVELGLITPPIGMNLFVLRGAVPDLPLETIIRGILPFVLADIVRLAILLAIPAISLGLPARMI